MNVAKYSESTLTKILNIIDDYSHNKDEELASLLCIGIKEVGYFVIQFNIFDSMGSCCDNKYVNYFYKINIITCELVELIRMTNQIENIKQFSSVIFNNDIQIETRGK